MTKTTLDNILQSALEALTRARVEASYKPEGSITDAGERLAIRVSGGTVVVSTSGDVEYTPDSAMTDSLRLAERTKSVGFITGLGGRECPNCRGTGRV